MCLFLALDKTDKSSLRDCMANLVHQTHSRLFSGFLMLDAIVPAPWVSIHGGVFLFRNLFNELANFSSFDGYFFSMFCVVLSTMVGSRDGRDPVLGEVACCEQRGDQQLRRSLTVCISGYCQTVTCQRKYEMAASSSCRLTILGVSLQTATGHSGSVDSVSTRFASQWRLGKRSIGI